MKRLWYVLIPIILMLVIAFGSEYLVQKVDGPYRTIKIHHQEI